MMNNMTKEYVIGDKIINEWDDGYAIAVITSEEIISPSGHRLTGIRILETNDSRLTVRKEYYVDSIYESKWKLYKDDCNYDFSAVSEEELINFVIGEGISI